MRQSLFKGAITAVLFSLILVSCKKELAKSDNSVQTGEETQLKAGAQKEIDDQQQEISNFGKEFEQFRNDESATGQLRGSKRTIVDIASSLPIFRSLVAAVVKTGLAPTLSDASVNLTVFAPTDGAFAKLPAPFNNASNISGIVDPGQIETLKTILLYHVLGSEVKSKQVARGRSTVTTLKSQVNGNDNSIFISNEILLAINGTSLVLWPDIDASNGVIHIINKVLSFPTANIAEIAIGNPAFSTLVAALVKTDLASVFTGSGDFTVFAPTNDAFSELPAPYNTADNINAITDQAQIDALANILKYHVIGSRYFTLDLGFFRNLTTLANPASNSLTSLLGYQAGYIKGKGNNRFATISPGNILATNGVIQVVNKVLLP